MQPNPMMMPIYPPTLPCCTPSATKNISIAVRQYIGSTPAIEVPTSAEGKKPTPVPATTSIQIGVENPSESQNTNTKKDPTPLQYKVLHLPLNAIHQLPHCAPRRGDRRMLVLCKDYDPRRQKGCSRGKNCHFVHADLHAPPTLKHCVHVNFAWRSLEDVGLPHLVPGTAIQICPPNSQTPAELVPSELILITAGVTSYFRGATKYLAHCAHYHFNAMCSRGEDCNFVHTLYIDAKAREFQRAPRRVGAAYVNGACPPPGSAWTTLGMSAASRHPTGKAPQPVGLESPTSTHLVQHSDRPQPYHLSAINVNEEDIHESDTDGGEDSAGPHSSDQEKVGAKDSTETDSANPESTPEVAFTTKGASFNQYQYIGGSGHLYRRNPYSSEGVVVGVAPISV